MNRLFRTLQFVAQCITLGLAAAFLIGLFAPQWSRGLRERIGAGTPSDTAPAAPATMVPTPKETQPPHHMPGFGPGNAPAESGSERDARTVRSASYSSAVARAAPAVVSIYADLIETRVEQKLAVPNDPRLRQVLGAIPLGPPITRSLQAQSLGSGVIVNADGYVLTNFHVIKGATNIKAVLQDGRVVIAKLIGTDEETDLAVLRLDATYLNTLPISGQNPTVGDVVLAIGNPI
jgi:serine protease DegQ